MMWVTLFIIIVVLFLLASSEINQSRYDEDTSMSSRNSWMKRAGQKHSLPPKTQLVDSSSLKKGAAMSSGKDIVIYKYSRGDKYSCHVTIINGETVVFGNIVTPPNTPDEVTNKMLDDAETEAMKEYLKDEEAGWTSGGG
jgi:hypothetical protein